MSPADPRKSVDIAGFAVPVFLTAAIWSSAVLARYYGDYGDGEKYGRCNVRDGLRSWWSCNVVFAYLFSVVAVVAFVVIRRVNDVRNTMPKRVLVVICVFIIAVLIQLVAMPIWAMKVAYGEHSDTYDPEEVMLAEIEVTDDYSNNATAGDPILYTSEYTTLFDGNAQTAWSAPFSGEGSTVNVTFSTQKPVARYRLVFYTLPPLAPTFFPTSWTLEYAVPHTQAPPTDAPQTAAPPTIPPTSAPDTIAPETIAPETGAPETTAPETGAPETAAPETSSPGSPGIPLLAPRRLARAEANDTATSPSPPGTTPAPATPAPDGTLWVAVDSSAKAGLPVENGTTFWITVACPSAPGLPCGGAGGGTFRLVVTAVGEPIDTCGPLHDHMRYILVFYYVIYGVAFVICSAPLIKKKCLYG